MNIERLEDLLHELRNVDRMSRAVKGVLGSPTATVAVCLQGSLSFEVGAGAVHRLLAAKDTELDAHRAALVAEIKGL